MDLLHRSGGGAEVECSASSSTRSDGEDESPPSAAGRTSTPRSDATSTRSSSQSLSRSTCDTTLIAFTHYTERDTTNDGLLPQPHIGPADAETIAAETALDAFATDASRLVHVLHGFGATLSFAQLAELSAKKGLLLQQVGSSNPARFAVVKADCYSLKCFLWDALNRVPHPGPETRIPLPVLGVHFAREDAAALCAMVNMIAAAQMVTWKLRGEELWVRRDVPRCRYPSVPPAETQGQSNCSDDLVLSRCAFMTRRKIARGATHAHIPWSRLENREMVSVLYRRLRALLPGSLVRANIGGLELTSGPAVTTSRISPRNAIPCQRSCSKDVLQPKIDVVSDLSEVEPHAAEGGSPIRLVPPLVDAKLSLGWGVVVSPTHRGGWEAGIAAAVLRAGRCMRGEVSESLSFPWAVSVPAAFGLPLGDAMAWRRGRDDKTSPRCTIAAGTWNPLRAAPRTAQSPGLVTSLGGDCAAGLDLLDLYGASTTVESRRLVSLATHVLDDAGCAWYTRLVSREVELRVAGVYADPVCLALVLHGTAVCAPSDTDDVSERVSLPYVGLPVGIRGCAATMHEYLRYLDHWLWRLALTADGGATKVPDHTEWGPRAPSHYCFVPFPPESTPRLRGRVALERL